MKTFLLLLIALTVSLTSAAESENRHPSLRSGEMQVNVLDTKHCPYCGHSKIKWWPEPGTWSCDGGCGLGGDLQDMYVDVRAFSKVLERDNKRLRTENKWLLEKLQSLQKPN